jgi:hypothetical protein
MQFLSKNPTKLDNSHGCDSMTQIESRITARPSSIWNQQTKLGFLSGGQKMPISIISWSDLNVGVVAYMFADESVSDGQG